MFFQVLLLKTVSKDRKESSGRTKKSTTSFKRLDFDMATLRIAGKYIWYF